MRACDICGRPAVIRDLNAGLSLCGDCLFDSIKERAFKVLREELRKDDRVIVALSGGKDSSLALYLTKMYADEEGLDLMALTVDEGTFYRKASIQIAKKLTSSLGVRHEVVEMKSIHGISIEELHYSLPRGHKRSACTYCGVFRRQTINAVARRLGATVVVTGHNLDDVVQTGLMNLMRGDVNALSKLFSHERRVEEGLIPRVKPLKMIYEREVAAVVLAKGIPAHLGKCPYTQGMRIGIRRVIDEIEEEYPGAKLRALSILETLAKHREEVKLRRCEVCGEPTTSRLCKACQMKRELSELFNRSLLKPLSLEELQIKGF